MFGFHGSHGFHLFLWQVRISSRSAGFTTVFHGLSIRSHVFQPACVCMAEISESSKPEVCNRVYAFVAMADAPVRRRLSGKQPVPPAGPEQIANQAIADEGFSELTALDPDARRRHVHWTHVRTIWRFCTRHFYMPLPLEQRKPDFPACGKCCASFFVPRAQMQG